MVCPASNGLGCFLPPVQPEAGRPPLSPRRIPGSTRATAAPEPAAQPPSRAPVVTLWPSLGDTYGQDRTCCSSECPSGIRSKVAATEFRDVFLESIPVLQWAQHARQDEYRRLRRFPGAHGWRDVGWDVVQAALSLLNTSANGALLERGRRGPCVRCAVVGNGGILNGSGAGRAIDAHDYVFRVNGAITEGFERDVGNRTSFYVFSTNTLMNSLSSYAADGFRHPPQTPETRYVFLPDHDRDYLLLRAAVSGQRVQRGRDRGAWPQELFGEQLRAAKFKMLHPDFVRYVRNRFLWADILATPRHALYRPSTGAVMLLAALHTCDEVSAFGFLTPDYQAYSDHYFDRRHKQVQFFANHDLRKEMQLWQQLQRCGLLHLYTGRTGT
ncbi:alpha-N-acetylgalactosaminide alpha-2,6-sialyltransferase 2-like [Nothoprocta perdicaria]|uniref:alpha-N-acetylgalactosaminide alpha-2,6-sialyltransferase 2-like n=1 Tax=Nothoprocta perdicaria TaxID=30464 RepID=UPI000E1C3CAF|nr:alpha-N-acetylgalactosaminide alpha-2,6-sialyltransferase 2-like [Nothoprocta perdicaria]